MDDEVVKHRLHVALRLAEDAVVGKLEGLSDHDVRRPLTPTSTNLLGLVKHLAVWESRYLGAVFGRPFPESLPAWDDREYRGTDMWAAADESRADVLGLFDRVRAHASGTVAALPLGAAGHVAWWREPRTTLLDVLVHLTKEATRHAGHADVLREQVDGIIGSVPGRLVRVDEEPEFWARRRALVEHAAGSPD